MEANQEVVLTQSVKELANSISSFCQNPCQARCCRVGELLLNKKEASAFSKKTLRDDGDYTVVLRIDGCEHLTTDATCNIYDSRPSLCRSFPLFLKGESLLVAQWCPAVKEGLLLPGLLALQEQYPKLRIINI